MNSSGDTQATTQGNGYIELGTGSTDFISGAEVFANTGENFDNGYINPVSYTHLTLPTIYSV